jgi:hydrogenase expression/formation protein HypD
MELVAALPKTRIEGFLAAGHAATITGWGIFEPMAKKYNLPIVVAGFEPLDILAGLVELLQLIKHGEARALNAYPRCVTREGNLRAQETLWKVFRIASGMWRGIAVVPNGNLILRDEWEQFDSRKKFKIDLTEDADYAPSELLKSCICGSIMSGMAYPDDCTLFRKECVPERPVGACMVSSEGTCKIWFEYGGRPQLGDSQ